MDALDKDWHKNDDLGSIFLARIDWVSQTRELLGFSIKKRINQSERTMNEKYIL